MRATERNTFHRECEQSESDLQVMQAEMAQVEEDREELRSVALEILAYFDLTDYVECFLESPDGLAVLANCCNCAAKCYDCELYEHKPVLINLATAFHPECWQVDGIVYIETSVGQVSFHALYGEDAGLPEANGRVWSEVEMQFNAGLVALAFIESWSKGILLQKIVEKCAASEELAA